VWWEGEPVETNPRNDDGAGEAKSQDARNEQTSVLQHRLAGGPGARAEPAEQGGQKGEDQHADDVEHGWPHLTRIEWGPIAWAAATHKLQAEARLSKAERDRRRTPSSQQVKARRSVLAYPAITFASIPAAPYSAMRPTNAADTGCLWGRLPRSDNERKFPQVACS